MSRIRVLDRAVAERIAAGEVVERPAAVVKELVENSLDAGARVVTVEVEGAGLRLIRVSDDGCGMDPQDAPLAVQRFATSKIAHVADLERVATYGFRGEALPSIAAVSRLELVTRPPTADLGTRVVVVGGRPPVVSAAGTAPGTVVTVTELFANTPARRKFLKSPGREFALIADAVQRLALAAPAVTFRLRHDGREILVYPAATQQERLAQVLGRDLAAAMLPLRGGGGEMAVGGWVVRPERARPGRQVDYLYVGCRPVHSRMLSRAIVQGYAELMPAGRFPTAVVFLWLDPSLVDVNVHPRKLEVRFNDEHRIFAAVVRAVREALRQPQGLRATPAVRAAPSGLPPAVVGEAWSNAGPGSPPRAVSPGAGTRAVAEMQPLYPQPAGRLPPLRPVGQMLATYLLAEASDGLVLVDQHAAHERVLYERLLREASAGSAAQLLAVPVPVDLTAAEMAVLDEFLPAAAALGFLLEPFGETTILVRGTPAALTRGAPEDLVRRALGAMVDLRRGDEVLRHLAIATACHTAVRAGDPMTPEEMEALLRDLAATEDPFTCFHGRPTMVWVSRQTLEHWFLRR
ncbi:MAG: DNA mismatch repair endonuclease MutL [Armatimonadota bacterium]|nr:DNA mismatch repair endonuclease MutL [Armatimonadota bacterium]MDR7468754.1 DNA mismatch repair endonuclease MutL [Armatimonadota bacterium]MDR7474802.1 DNA mismatch repair endonuclease MutL [Armatimonadota bacterium]MDR7538581.1 DNA mismatch repair endonuclease MutL [Armatimonadota bacterium]